MKYLTFHFSRIVIATTLCLFAAGSLCQTKPPVEQKLGNPTLQKIIQVREMRDSMDRKHDSLLLERDKAIALKNGRNTAKKNR